MSDGLRYGHAFQLYLYYGFSTLVVMELLIKLPFSSWVFSCVIVQPVEVWTKCGRRGRIKEPVGTHGMVPLICF